MKFNDTINGNKLNLSCIYRSCGREFKLAITGVALCMQTTEILGFLY